MPDLPELYEALDIELAYIVGRHRVKFSDEEMQLMTSIVSALCAAIEVKQSQELHEYLNRPNRLTIEYLRPIMQKAAKTKNCSGYGLDSSDFDWDYLAEEIENTTTT